MEYYRDYDLSTRYFGNTRLMTSGNIAEITYDQYKDLFEEHYCHYCEERILHYHRNAMKMCCTASCYKAMYDERFYKRDLHYELGMAAQDINNGRILGKIGRLIKKNLG